MKSCATAARTPVILNCRREELAETAERKQKEETRTERLPSRISLIGGWLSVRLAIKIVSEHKRQPHPESKWMELVLGRP